MAIRKTHPADIASFKMAEEVVERLARLEEQMRHVIAAVEKLSRREADLEENLRSMSDRINAGLATQADTFRSSLKDVTDTFVSREDWAFWKSLLTAALLALLAFGWNNLIGTVHK